MAWWTDMILAQWKETVHSIMKPFLQRSPFQEFQHVIVLAFPPWPVHTTSLQQHWESSKISFYILLSPEKIAHSWEPHALKHLEPTHFNSISCQNKSQLCHGWYWACGYCSALDYTLLPNQRLQSPGILMFSTSLPFASPSLSHPLRTQLKWFSELGATVHMDRASTGLCCNSRHWVEGNRQPSQGAICKEVSEGDRSSCCPFCTGGAGNPSFVEWFLQ